MVNRSPSCRYVNSDSSQHHSNIHALFSAAAVRRCCGKSQTRTEEQIQIIADVIDNLLLSMAEEGYAQPTEISSIAHTSKEIRRTGRLNAAPWDHQPRLEVKCMIPKVGASAPSEGSGQANNEADVAPSKVWSQLGGQQYKFVGRSKWRLGIFKPR